MKKFVSLLLAALLFAGVLCACHKEDVPDEPDPVAVFPAGSSEWTVIYGADDHFRCVGAAHSLRRTLRETLEYLPAMKSDATVEPSADAKEVLVGNTNRPESAQALNGLADNEYVITFDGTKLVINAKDPYGVRYAMRKFLAEHQGEIALRPNYVEKGTFAVPETVKVLDALHHGVNISPGGNYAMKYATEAMFAAIEEGGFDHVRIAGNLYLCVDKDGNFIDEEVACVDNAVKWAFDHHLTPILDFHGWEGLCTSIPAQSDVDLFVKIWTFFAERYKDYPAALCFELYNEPCYIPDIMWDKVQLLAYNAIRAVDEDRIIFLSPASWNDPTAAAGITVPYDDDAVAIDMHDYSPHEFTHQGVADRPKDVAYTKDVFKQWADLFDKAVIKRKSAGVPVLLGEFSVSPWIEDTSVITAFLSDVTTYMDARDFPWTYWDLVGYWKLYDLDKGEWVDYRLKGLRGEAPLYNK